MWVARDKSGCLHLFSNKPVRHLIGDFEYWRREEPYSTISLPNSLYPELKWEDEPIEVELVSKK